MPLSLFDIAASHLPLCPQDILSMADYGPLRAQKRQEIVALKRHRRVDVGPYASFYFENRATMWFQIQEMLWIERGGAGQLADELAAYNPLVPNGRELVATVMFEIDNPHQRKALLLQLGGVEESFTLEVAGQIIYGVAEQDVDRTNAAGKASSVQFVHFPLTDSQTNSFKSGKDPVKLAVTHPRYFHQTQLLDEVRQALAADLL
jgi:Protein of unknown function (DUF3501)